MTAPKGPVFIRFGSGRTPGLFSVLLTLLILAVLFVAGVWLFMLAATVLVLALPYLWWKKRKLQQQVAAMMQAQQAAYHGQSARDPGDLDQSGVVIEGEVITKRSE